MTMASGIPRSLPVISLSIAGTPRSGESRLLKLFMPTNTVPALVLYWLSMKL